MKKNKWIGICAVIAVIAVGGFTVATAMAGDTSSSVNYTTINQTELINSISAKGTVESINKSNVYSTVSGTIKDVMVEVGTVVTEGQILCELDTEDLILNIAQQKADLNASEQSNLSQLQSNQRVYNEAVSNINNGTNSQILNAESTLKTAKANLETAQKNYDDALREYQDGTNSQLTTAESNLLSAKLDLDTKEKNYVNNKVLFDNGVISKEENNQSEIAYTNAQNKYNDALVGCENAESAVEKALEQSENALKTAQINYDAAVEAKKAAEVLSKQDLEKYKSNIENSQIAVSNDSKIIAIQKLEKQLADSSIKSPISGTVTSVYAKEGATGTGLLFVIEDTDNLKVTTKIKEYDVGKVKNGMSVTIKSDSTGDAAYEGVVSKVAPAAVKNASGETASTTDVEFAAEIDVVSAKTDLKIGMNTRLNLVLEKKEGVFCVPYDAIATNTNGESVVYAAVDGSDNKYVAKQIAVTTGLETDFYVEISGSGLSQGMKIISDASKMQDNMKITLN